MSDTDTDADPVISFLRERKTELKSAISTNAARLLEVENLLSMLSDGRTRVRRRLREVPAPPDSQPETAA